MIELARKRKAQWKSDAQFNFGSPTKTNVEVAGSGEDAYIRLLAQLPGSVDVDFNTPADYSYDDTKIVVAGGKAKIKAHVADEHNWPFTVDGSYVFDGAKIEVTGGVARLRARVPYAWWHFDESSGTNLADSSGNGRDGTTVNMDDGNWVAGKLGNCLKFEKAYGEHVNCGNIAGFERTDPFSLECWFKWLSGANLALMGKITNIIGVGYYIIFTTGQVYFNIQNTQANRIKVRTVLAGLMDNNWHHLVITYDGSSDASGVHIYIDGNDEATYVAQNDLSMTIINSANFNFGMMKDQFDDPAFYYNGKIDEGVIYDRELSQSDVTARWNGGAGAGGAPVPYGWWHLNESIGINVPDSSGNGHDGTTTDMEDSDWVAGKLNNCLRFDGVDEYVNLGDIANFERTDPFSAECWFKSISATIQAIFGRMGDTAPTRGWAIELNASGNLVCYMINDAGIGNYIYVYIPTTDWADGVWHHLVFTYDGSSSASGIHIYVDGIDKTLTVGTDALSATIQNSHICTISTLNGVVYPFNGDIDEVVFYDRELTASDVSFRWSDGSGTEGVGWGDYPTDEPDIYPSTGFVFTSPIDAFTETTVKPAGTEIKYQISSDDGVTWKWWNGAAWIVITGGQTDSWYYTNESNSATGVNTNISSLSGSGTLRFRAFLHSDGTDRPKIDNIYVVEGVAYPVGSFEISMVNDIQPAVVVEWETVTEIVTKPENTDIKYQYSIDAGVSYNGSWLTASELQTALGDLFPVGDSTDTLRIKIQLTSSDSTMTPEIDNLNFTYKGVYAISGSYVSTMYSPNDEEVCWGVVSLGIDVPKGATLKVYIRFSAHVLDPGTEYLEVTDGQSLSPYPAEQMQWKVEMTGDGIVTPKVESFELTYTVRVSVQKDSQDILSRVETLLGSIEQHTEPTESEPAESEPTEPPKAGFKV